MNAPVGIRNPISTTALGKELVAWLDEAEVRELLRISGMPALTPNSIRTADDFVERLQLGNLILRKLFAHRVRGFFAFFAAITTQQDEAQC